MNLKIIVIIYYNKFLKLFINKVKYIKFLRLKFCENFLDYISVNRVFNLKSSIILVAKFKYNNNLILSDILDYNFLNNN